MVCVITIRWRISFALTWATRSRTGGFSQWTTCAQCDRQLCGAREPSRAEGPSEHSRRSRLAKLAGKHPIGRYDRTVNRSNFFLALRSWG